MFYLNGQTNPITVTSSGNTFKGNGLASYGSVYYIYSTSVNTVSLSSDTYTSNYAIYGGSIYCYYCDL